MFDFSKDWAGKRDELEREGEKFLVRRETWFAG